MKHTNLHSFDNSCPEFLNLLESDWRKAAKLFAIEAYRYLRRLNPPILASLSYDKREDSIQEIIFYFIDNECKNLKKYEDQNNSFKSWFTFCSIRKAISLLRTKRKNIEFHEEEFNVHDNPSKINNRQKFMHLINSGAKNLSRKCQLMISAFYRGHSFVEIANLLGYEGLEPNKKAADDFNYCKKRLKKWFADKDMNLNQLLELLN